MVRSENEEKPQMDISTLVPEDRVRTRDGSVVEIVAATEDGRWIKVRYLESTDTPKLVGTEDLCSEEELVSKVGESN